MRHFLRAKSLAPFLWIGAVLAVPLPATAGNTGTNNDWQYAASIYLWGAGIDGETATGGEVDIRFETLISNLNMALMGSFEARKSEWSILTDVVYLNVGDDGAGRVQVTTESGATLPLKVDTGV